MSIPSAQDLLHGYLRWSPIRSGSTSVKRSDDLGQGSFLLKNESDQS